MNRLRIILASKLLGENVADIQERTESFKNDTVKMKSDLKESLRYHNAVAQKIKDSKEHLNNLHAQFKAAQQKLEEKKTYGDLLNNISSTETSIAAKESDIEKENLRNYEKKRNLDILNRDVTSLKVGKDKLNQEKEELQGKTGISEEEKELQSVIHNISDYQEWLRKQSPELDTIKTKIEKRIKEIEEPKPEVPQTPPEKPEDKNPRKPKDDDKSPEDEKGGLPIKEEPHEESPDYSVKPKVRKKRDYIIKEIYDMVTGKTIIAEDFFKKDINELIEQRNIFQDYISQGKRRFLCPKCLEMIRISGRGDERGNPCIFTHKNDSVYCARTTTGLSKEEIERRKYGLVGQSERHKQLKQELFNCLSDSNSVALGVQNVEMEKRLYSSLPFFNFRQPDVQIEYDGKKIVFEIQLSTTFLSVIKERDTFYRLNGYYIIWVFNFEDNKKYVDLNNLAMKDIYFANKWNAFIFDEDARQWSRERKQLVLKCNWLEPDLTWHYKNTSEHFGGEPVTLDQLSYDSDTFKPYLIDAEKAYFDEHPEKINQFISEQKSREERIKELEEQAQDKDVKRREAIELIKEKGGNVIPFEVKKHFGFQHGVNVIIDPKFTSCEKQENGTFIVGFNRKKGLVNQYGEMLRECDYNNIYQLSGNAYLAEGTKHFWLCNIQEAFTDRVAGDYVTHEMMRERVELVKLYHRGAEEEFCSFYIIDGQKLLANIGSSTVFVDLDGNKIVDDEFTRIMFQSSDFVQIQRKSDNMWNTMDFDGVYDGEWSTDRPSIPFEHNLTLFYKGDYQGLKDKDGNIIVDPTHVEILANPHFSYIILKDVRIEHSYYYWQQNRTITSFTLVGIDGTKDSIPERFQHAFSIIRFVNNDMLQIGNVFVRLPGFHVIAEGCEDAIELDNGFLIITKGKKVGLNSHEGDVIIPCGYDNIDLWHNEIYICKSNRKYGYYNTITTYDLIDSSGVIIQSGFQSIGRLINGKANVTKGGQEGEIDSSGQIIVNEKKEFTNGLKGKKYLGFWELSDSAGNIVWEQRNGITSADSFNDKLIVVETKQGKGLIDSTGKIVLSCSYSSVSIWTNNLILARRGDSSNSHYRLCKENGEVVNNREYDFIEELKEGKAAVKIGSYTGYIDEKGQPLPDNEIALSDGNIKYSIIGKWGIRSPQGTVIIDCTNDEITSYKGYYVVINSSDVDKTNIKTTNVIPVTGVRSGSTEKSIIFNVAGKGFLVSKSMAKKKWGDKVPEKLELIIMNLCLTKNRYTWKKKKVSVIAKPYSSKKIQKRETDINEIIQGIIAWVNYGSAIVKLDGGSTVFVHKSNFKQIKLDKNYKGRKIEIKKIGVDVEHQKDVWEILNLESPVVAG